MLGEINPKLKSFLTTANVAFTTATAPAIFRQLNGVINTSEVQIYHDGSDGHLVAKAGILYLEAPSGIQCVVSATYKPVSADSFITQTGVGLITGRLGANYGVVLNSTNLVAWNSAANLGGSTTGDVALARVSAGVVAVTDATAGTDVTLRLQRKSSTTNNRNLGGVVATGVVTTDASRTGRIAIVASDFNGDREGIRVQADGTQPLVGFYGATAIAKPSGSIITGLSNLGLITTPTIDGADITSGTVGTSFLGSGTPDVGYALRGDSTWAPSPRVLFSQSVGNTFNNTTTETTLLGTGLGSLTLPAGYLNLVGRSLRFTSSGRYSTTTGTNGVVFYLKFGSLILGVSTLNLVASQSNQQWIMQQTLTVASIGASGVALCDGSITYFNNTGTPQYVFFGGTLTFDTTATHVVNMTGTWTVANAANSLTSRIFTIEAVN